MACLFPDLMTPLSSFRFRIFTRGDRGELVPGASTLVRAASQSEALADLTRQLCSWEIAAPLYGPSRLFLSFN